MPLEISEIGVHVAVDPSVPPAPSFAPVHESGGGAALTPVQTETIVQACVDRVLANVRQLEER